ncbi:MAG: restriction endonuclease subunit S, partial [Proteobacteria bacterium]|nr:restriction endonuclease subunit S [Pseudomonadota bacterium]
FYSPELKSFFTSIDNADLQLNKEYRNPSKFNTGDTFTYIDISSLPPGPSTINIGKIVSKNAAPSRARRVIKKDDIIISTVRPNLRSFAKIGEKLDNQICSTGFAVFSCGSSINPDFLLFQFCSPFFVDQCVSKTTGGHYPAINETNLRKVQIIVPPLPEQYRIVAYFNNLQEKVSALKKLQSETATELDAMLPSILDKAFRGELLLQT